jgi:hypothetical protein
VKVSKLDRPTPPVREPEKDWRPLIAWGRGPFAPPDEADGAHVGGITLHRGPDGRLYGVADAKKETN